MRKAEDLSETCNEITEQKLKENKEIVEKFNYMEENIAALNDALSNSKREILRLNKEILREQDNAKSLLNVIEDIKEQKLQRENDLNREIGYLMTQIEYLNNTLENKSVTKPIRKNTVKSPVVDKKKLSAEQEILHLKDELLKSQLEIVDLKKKIEDEEISKAKVQDMLKLKKDKGKKIKNDLEKLLSLFEECGREVIWNKDLVSQKNNMIKVLKDRINKLNSDNKQLLAENEKLTGGKNKSEIGINCNLDELIPVVANPQKFQK
jgi:chromosome segregation ATPase